MLIAMALAALTSYPSPAEAGVQYRADRTWAPAFAGEGKKDRLGEQSAPVRRGAMSPIDAERAFAADAQTLGQWTAFRKWSTDQAVMFVPQPVNAHEWLKDRKDPAKAIEWWPTASYISCDGEMAVNTGGWRRVDGVTGYFSTVWYRQPDGSWKWLLDSGDETATVRERPAKLEIIKAACRAKKMPFTVDRKPDRQVYMGGASDTSLNWIVFAYPDGRRHFTVEMWDGRTEKIVIRDEIPAAK